jgi:hypothetical protein
MKRPGVVAGDAGGGGAQAGAGGEGAEPRHGEVHGGGGRPHADRGGPHTPGTAIALMRQVCDTCARGELNQNLQ